MRWVKEKETFREYTNRFLCEFNQEEEYIIWGAGSNSSILFNIFGKCLKVAYFIDNDSEKQGKSFRGKLIYSPEYLKENNKEHKIIITPSNSAYNNISKQILNMGVTEEKFCSFEEILLIWKWRNEHEIVLPQVDFMINTVCSLNCEQCAYHIPYAKIHMQRDLDNLKKDVDNFFGTIDYCIRTRISGGEPLLYKKLPELVEYISDKYINQFEVFEIITNATILPSEELLKVIKHNKGKFHISDYKPVLHERVKTDEIESILKKRKILYSREVGFNVQGEKYTWFDMGSPIESRNRTEEELRKHFAECRFINCKHIYEGKLIYCGIGGTASIEGIYQWDENDFIILDKWKKSDEYAEDIIRFYLGYLDKGYVSYCDYCNGFSGNINNHYVPAGKQL